MMSDLPSITDQEFEQKVLRSKIPILVEFFSATCGTCKMLQTTLAALQQEIVGRALIYKIDAERNPAAVEAQGVFGVPTTLLFVGGERRAEFCGPQQKDELLGKIREFLPPEEMQKSKSKV